MHLAHRPALVVVAAVGLLGGGGACTTDGTADAATTTVTAPATAKVVTATYLPVATLDGSLIPDASVQLGFDVPGRLERLLVARGEVVERGQALATLDDRMARAQLAQAEAALAGAEAQLASGEAGFERARQLHAAGGLSEQAWGEAEAGILAGRAGVEQARAAVLLARTHVANHTLRAPIAGTISNGPDNAGTMVGAGTPMFLLEDLTALQLKGSVSDDATWLSPGLAATVTAGTDPLGVPGTVSRVLQALDPSTRRLPVEIRVADPPASLRAHAYARATVSAAVPTEVTAVPAAAVVARPDFSVIVERQGIYTRVPVRVLGEASGLTLVSGALSPGDNVVLYPPSGLGGEG